MTSRTALVVGAGIGGLTTAIALRRAGWHVRVLQATPKISAVGAGIILQPNAMTALETLDAAEPIAAVGVAVRSARQVGRTEEALRRFASLTLFPEYQAASALRRGEIFESMSAVDSAVAQYSVFLDWWQNADSEFQPLVEDVRARVARLMERER